MTEDWDNHDDGQGVEVVEKIVCLLTLALIFLHHLENPGVRTGSSVRHHHTALTSSHRANTTIVKVVDWEVEEDSTSDERALHITHILVRPGDGLAVERSDTLLRKYTGFRRLEEVGLPNSSFAVLERDTHDLPDLVQGTSVGWRSYELVAEVP